MLQNIKTWLPGYAKIGKCLRLMAGWRRQLQLVSLVLAAFCALCLAFLPSGLAREQQTQQKEYGLQLGRLLADEVSVMLADQNLIGIQASLGDLLKGELAIAAAVYDAADIEVVSQTAPGVSTQQLSTAGSVVLPLALNENYLGRLDISLPNQAGLKGSVVITLLSIAAWLSFVVLLFLYFLPIIVREAPVAKDPVTKTPVKTPDVTDTVDPVCDSTATGSLPVNPDPSPAAVLTIELAGMEALYKKFSAESRNTVLAEIDQIIKQVLVLYKGQILTCHTGVITLAFFAYGNNEENATAQVPNSDAWFNALCTGYLFVEIAKARQWLQPLHVVLSGGGYEVDSADYWMQWRSFKRNQLEDNGCSLVIDRNDKDGFLPGDFIVDEDQAQNTSGVNRFLRVQSLQPKYQRLLDKQLQSLLRHV